MNALSLQETSIRFINNVYKPCVEKCKSTGDIQDIIEILNHGKAVLDSEMKCDQYIAFYGGHHFHKLFTAFASTNFQFTNGKNLEIIDWGCGQALATCVLIDYFIENSLNPSIVSITLIEPSLISLKRGYNFTCQMLRYRPYAGSAIRMVNKYIDDLESIDLASDANNIKVHLFSNIIDVEAFSLDKLHGLMLDSFQGLNRFICISPGGDRGNRLSRFHDLFSQSCKISNLITSEEPINEEIFYFKTRKYEERKITRCERQFTANLNQREATILMKSKISANIKQGDLFSSATDNEALGEVLEMPDAKVTFYPNFFNQEESDKFLQSLNNEINWRQDKIKMYGKEIDLPRKTAWYGDKDKSYKFSGIRLDPEPWTSTLLQIKKRIESIAEVNFNSVLLNLYRDGSDGISWHTDAEPELGENPVIGSVSFGETRSFRFQHRYEKEIEKRKIELTHGSFLLMAGETQHFWQHQVPKTVRKVESRINLTFRVIID